MTADGGPKTAYDGPKTARDGPKTAYDGPKTACDGPKTAYDGPKTACGGPKTMKSAAAHATKAGILTSSFLFFVPEALLISHLFFNKKLSQSPPPRSCGFVLNPLGPPSAVLGPS